MKRNSNKIPALFAGAVLLVLAMILMKISFGVFGRIKDSVALRKHTFQVIEQAGGLLAELVDAETGVRGYLLTGDENYLKPYLNVRDVIRVHLEDLSQQTRTGRAQMRLAALAPLVAPELAEMGRIIDLRRRGDLKAAMAVLGRGSGQERMGSIRADMRAFLKIENDIMTGLDADLRSRVGHLRLIILATGLLALLFVLLFTILTYRDSKNRLRSLVHVQTEHLLAAQKDTNHELHLTNNELQASEEKLAVTLNSIGDAVMATDAEGRVRLLNPWAEHLTGWTRGEALGRPVEDVFRIIDQETRLASPVPVQETLAKGTVRGLTGHTVLIARDGAERSIADSCAPIRGRDGRVAGAVLVFRDVSERRAIEMGLEKARQELEVTRISEHEAREYAESVIDTVREPLLVLDQDLRVLKASRSFFDVFRVKSGETLGQLIYHLGNKQWDIPKLRDLLETILPQQATFKDFEVEHDFAEIGRRTMLLNARQIRRALGKERIILLAIEDISERKAIEAGLEKTRGELEAANKELEAFTYSVSHDLRAPLRAVAGFSRILLDEHAAGLGPEVQRYLSLVLSNTIQMGCLVDDLLSFSRFSRQAMARGRVDPSALVRESFELLGDEQSGRSLKMTVGDLPACRGDRALLKQVFVNLLSNALKFTRHRDPAVIAVGSSRKGGETVYFVRDNGAGFDMRYVGKLFGVFQRLHAAEAYEGTGVGLAIVQRIVFRHGGRIWAEAEPDKGATFYFTLGEAESWT